MPEPPDRKEVGRSIKQDDGHIQDLVLAVVILDREVKMGGGQCIYGIGHHLPPNRCSLSGFMAEQAGETHLPLLMTWLDSTCETFYLLSKTVKG